MISRKTRLPIRLDAVLAAIPSDARVVADIGYDRGQLMAAILERRPKTAVVGVEVQPIAAARARAEVPTLVHDAKRVTLKTGDGLSALLPGEVDGAVLAGIGGRTIAKILLRDRTVVETMAWLVLCPPRFNGAIRPALAELDWHIADEALVTDRGRTYEVILARKGRETLPRTQLAARFGPVFFDRRDPALGPYLRDVRHRFKAAFERRLVDYGPTSNKPRLGEKLALLEDAIAETKLW
ncbi:MAG: tRNA (adenine22-N1)-methyltransferase [Myxococcota bacterium]|jgi:tRNA (adenine22-N1)-methyltransferase